MTTVKCRICGGDVYYTDMPFVSESDEYVGICWACFINLLKDFLDENGDVYKKLEGFLKEKTKISDGILNI